MTTLPANAAPAMTQRPATPQAAAMSAQAGSIDPLKLLNKHKWVLAGAAIAGAVLGTGAHFVLRSTYPKWRPVVLFNCLAPQEQAGGAGSAQGSGQEMDRFMQTQVKVMTSESVMTRVAEDEQLQAKAPKWAEQFQKISPNDGQRAFDRIEAAKELGKIVGARVIPQTNLIELSATDKRADDATEILALVRQKYTQVLREQNQSMSEDKVFSLRKALERIDEEMGTQARARQGLIMNEKLDSLDDRAAAAKIAMGSVTEDLQKVQNTLQAAQKQLEQMGENEKAGTFSPELIAQIEKDPSVLDVQATISRLETTRQMLVNRGVSTDHREMRLVDSNLEGARQNLERVKAEQLTKKFFGQLDELKKGVAQFQAQEKALLEQRTELQRRLNDIAQAQGKLNDIDSALRGLQETKARTNSDLQNLLSLAATSSFNRVVLLQAERRPTELAFPRLKMMIPAGLIVCVGLVGGVIFLREIVDQRVKGPSDIAIIPKTKLLGWVPDAAEDPSGQGATETAFRDRPRGIIAESYRQIRGSMGKRLQQADHKTILVIAGMPGSGASSTVSNLAFAFAAADKRVLVIDANFRRPTLHRTMGLQEAPGLADVLTRSAELSDVVQATSTPNLDLLGAGSKEHRVYERLATEAMGELLTKVRMMYDLVLIDCAPAMVAGDGIALAHRCDASLLVVRALAEKRGMIARLKNELADGRSEFLGVIVNAVRASSGGYMKGNIRAAHEYQQA